MSEFEQVLFYQLGSSEGVSGLSKKFLWTWNKYESINQLNGKGTIKQPAGDAILQVELNIILFQQCALRIKIIII